MWLKLIDGSIIISMMLKYDASALYCMIDDRRRSRLCNAAINRKHNNNSRHRKIAISLNIQHNIHVFTFSHIHLHTNFCILCSSICFLVAAIFFSFSSCSSITSNPRTPLFCWNFFRASTPPSILSRRPGLLLYLCRCRCRCL